MPSSISDHDLIYAVLKLKRQRPKPVYITTRNFKNYQQNASVMLFSGIFQWFLGASSIALMILTIASMLLTHYSMKSWTNMHQSQKLRFEADLALT